VGDVLVTATQNAPAFAKQMRISEKSLKNLLNTDPTAFLMQFSKSLKGVKGSDLGPLLKSLKLGDSGSIKVVGALSTNIERLTEFQALSNDEFAKGTSILNEFNVKLSRSLISAASPAPPPPFSASSDITSRICHAAPLYNPWSGV
jgi:hypothetical protein